MSSLKLNPQIAALVGDKVQCKLCETRVSQNLWTAHVNGKQHRRSVDRLKKQLSSPAAAAQAKRDASAPSASEPPLKRPRGTETASESGGGDLPSDFFDPRGGRAAATGSAHSSASTGSAHPDNAKAPWQRDIQEEKEVLRKRDGLIEGLPKGFFDDKKRDGKVRETAEKNEEIEADYEKLMKELAEQDAVAEAAREKEEDAEARARELAYIDEQMARLKELNELEKKRDAILEGRQARAEARAAFRKQAEDGDEQEDDGDEPNFDDWRSMSVIR